MPHKPCYLNLLFTSILSSLVSAASNPGAVISPQQVVVTPGESVSFSCTLPTNDVLSINWFINGELYNDQSDDEDIRTVQDSNGSGSIRFKNLQQTGRTSVRCQTTSISGQLSNSILASFSVIKKPVIKRPALKAESSGSNSGPESSFASGAGPGSAPESGGMLYTGLGPVPEYIFDSANSPNGTADQALTSVSSTPPGTEVPVTSSNTTTSNSTTTPASENSANGVYFSKSALMLIMTALGYSLH